MNFKPCAREQAYLLPPSLREWLPEDHLAWFVLDAVAQLDLSAFYEQYRADGTGQAAYHPRMMVAVLLYAYCTGIRSSRKIARACWENIAYRVLAANQTPDHATLARFRATHEQALEELFVQVLRRCAEAGLVKVGLVALDGTKLTANAALAANRTKEGLAAEVQRMMAEAAETDRREAAEYGAERRGDELPEGLRERGSRLARLREGLARLKAEAAAAQAEQAAKIAAREREEAATGKKKRGRKPKAPEAMVKEEAKANVTDPESRLMKTRKGYVQGYNAQAVATEGQIIVAADVTGEENDQRQAEPMLRQAQANVAQVGVAQRIRAAALDAGYWRAANAGWEAEAGWPELLIATTKDWKQRQAWRAERVPRGRIPKGLTVRERMERKLKTKRGRALYRKRSWIVEPVFGQVQTEQDGKRCMRRGESAARSEWRFTCAGHNLLKLWRSGRAQWN
jgi:transposase